MRLPTHPALPTALTKTLAAALLLAAAAPAAMAQYKVIGPDGSVTYTDRPPVATGAKVTPLNPRAAAAQADAQGDLPFELRQLTTRYPVTLYTSNDCPPCDAGRTLLQQRGVPYAEKRIASDDDAAALERVVGGRTVPSLMVGTQALRGLSQTDWLAYLDAAGYPRESRLPRSWQPPAATPMVERAAPPPRPAPAPQPAPQSRGAPAEADTSPVPANTPGNIRF